MANYGQGGPKATYDGTAPYEPTEKDLLHQLLGFFGINETENHNDDVGYNFQVKFAQMFGLPGVITGSPAMNKELYQKQLDWVAWGELDPVKNASLVDTVIQWMKSLHYVSAGNFTPIQPEKPPQTNPTGGLIGQVTKLVETGVKWPEEPPVWAGTGTSLTADDVREAVLSIDVPYENGIYGNISTTNLQDAFRLMLMHDAKDFALRGVVFPWLPDYVILMADPADWWYHAGGLWTGGGDTSTFPPPIRSDRWRTTDDYWSYLQREQPEWGWSTVDFGGTNNPDGFAWAKSKGGFPNHFWIRTQGLAHSSPFTRGGETSPAAARGVYPGASAVTFGPTVAVTGTGIFDAPCNGATITIEGLPPGQGKQLAGTVKRFPYVGWLSFVDDEGNADLFQRIELDKSLFVPQTMFNASQIAVYAKPGLQLTLHPWTVGQ